VLFPNETLILDGLVNIPFSQTLIQNIYSGSVLFDVYGYVVYDYAFGGRHITRFCRVFNPKENSGAGGFEFPRQVQPEYNDAD
jgi:hypothetical protein